MSHPWRAADDYELAKLPFTLFFVAGTGSEWDVDERPLPSSITWIPDARAVSSDVLLLQLDARSPLVPAERARLERLRDSYDGRVIALEHGAPGPHTASPDELRALLGDALLVCESLDASVAWGARRASTIVPGASVDEWTQTDFANHEVLCTLPASIPPSRGPEASLMERARARVPLVALGRDASRGSFAKYRRTLRSGSIFFHASHHVPAPRARMEAMLSGLAIVTTAAHGAGELIENGVTGFASDDDDELLAQLERLARDPALARAIGRAGRAVAREAFSIDRVADEWLALLARAVG